MDAGDNSTYRAHRTGVYLAWGCNAFYSARCNGLWRTFKLSPTAILPMNEAEGRSEMGQLAAGLKTMQQSLIRTVSAVRAITPDSIYTGAGEENFRRQRRPLFPYCTEQQASALETTASMEQLTATVRQNTDNALSDGSGENRIRNRA